MRANSRSEEHAGSAEELQFLPHDGHVREEAVDVVDSQTQGLAVQLVLLTNLYEPVNEDRTHVVINVRLSCHVVRLGTVVTLKTEHDVHVVTRSRLKLNLQN